MCGVFGIYGHKDAARLTYLGLYALQHRGEESAGIVVYNGKKISSHKGMGLVGDVFDEKVIKDLRGDLACGHVRYSTTGASLAKNIQPFLVNRQRGHIVVAHNGNLTNTLKLRQALEGQGSIFQTTMDSEIIAHLLVSPVRDKTPKASDGYLPDIIQPWRSYGAGRQPISNGVKSKNEDVQSSIVEALSQLEGAYSFVLMLNGLLVGARDPLGFRPLCLGRLDGAYILASESCALDLIQAEYIREIEPGEIVIISEGKLESIKPFPGRKHALCIFEYIYFARPDSNIFGKNVYLTRECLGRQLAREYPVNADLVMPIPDSGNYAAIGFAEESGIPFKIGMVRNHYVGRTFIQPSQFIRNFRVKVKLNPVRDVLKNKRIAVIEDSIVRGTTSRIRVKTLREAGAKELHMRISCPPLKFPCFYGIDFHTKKELVASKQSIEGIKDFMGLDSLKYLSLEGMLKSMLLPKEEFCTACFTGKYPTKLPKGLSKSVLEKKG